MRWLTLFTMLGLLWPGLAFAADGDGCDSDQSARISRGTVKHAWCVALCHNAFDDDDCAEFDLDSIGQTDIITFEMLEAGTSGTHDCTAAIATINTSGETGLTAADTNAFDIGSTTALSLVGTRRIVLDAKSAPLDRYIYVTTSGTAGCAENTDTFDVIMYGSELSR